MHSSKRIFLGQWVRQLKRYPIKNIFHRLGILREGRYGFFRSVSNIFVTQNVQIWANSWLSKSVHSKSIELPTYSVPLFSLTTKLIQLDWIFRQFCIFQLSKMPSLHFSNVQSFRMKFRNFSLLNCYPVNVSRWKVFSGKAIQKSNSINQIRNDRQRHLCWISGSSFATQSHLKSLATGL